MMSKINNEKYIKIKPVKPNETMSRDYYYTLEKMIKSMNKEIIDCVNDKYKKTNETINDDDNKVIASDFGVVLTFNKSIQSILNKYIKKFSSIADTLSTSFINQISKYTTKKLDNNIEKKTGLSIKTNKNTISFLEKKQLQINENVNLIKSIPEKYKEKVNIIVNQSLIQGRNLSYLNSELMKIEGMTKRRAKNISIDQLNKATNVVNNARMEEFGITKAIWQHSGASKEPRPDHVAATGKVYDIKKGCKISGQYIQPGQLINCKCISVPVIEI